MKFKQSGDGSWGTNERGLLQNAILQKFSFLKVRNSGRNHEPIVVSTAKILCKFPEKSILQQILVECPKGDIK